MWEKNIPRWLLKRNNGENFFWYFVSWTFSLSFYSFYFFSFDASGLHSSFSSFSINILDSFFGDIFFHELLSLPFFGFFDRDSISASKLLATLIKDQTWKSGVYFLRRLTPELGYRKINNFHISRRIEKFIEKFAVIAIVTEQRYKEFFRNFIERKDITCPPCL